MVDMVIILDSDFKSESVLDVFESLIWTTRYKEAGEFELYTPINEKILNDVKVGKYLFEGRFMDVEADEAHLMIIESIELDDQHLKVTGRSLKSILDRRIIWGQKVVEAGTSVLSVVTDVINDAIVNPELTDRKIDNFVFDTASGDWGTYEEQTQYEGNSLLEFMNDICTKYKIGYQIVYNFTDGKFHMRLIEPVDHSYEQIVNPPVIFAAKFNNLKNSKYLESSAKYKNVAFVSGEKYQDDDINKYHQTAIFGDATGLDRRELFIDGSSITHQLDDGTIYGTATYQKMLEQHGEAELNKKDNAYERLYEGEADNAERQYQFMRDYNIGDTVEIITKYGMSSTARVSEMVLNISTSGITFVPTFEDIREEEENT